MFDGRHCVYLQFTLAIVAIGSFGGSADKNNVIN